MNHDRPRHHARDLLHDAAVAAEQQIGRSEPSVAAAERHVVIRLARAGFGFVVIGAGIAMLPLPGPGWLVIIAGLSMLPFAWAKRLVTEIRRRIPGIPAEGRISLRTKAAYAVVVIASTVLLMAFGGAATEWLVGLGDPERLFG